MSRGSTWGPSNVAGSSPLNSPCVRERVQSLLPKERENRAALLPLAWPSVCFLKEYWWREKELMLRLITQDTLGGPISSRNALQIWVIKIRREEPFLISSVSLNLGLSLAKYLQGSLAFINYTINRAPVERGHWLQEAGLGRQFRCPWVTAALWTCIHNFPLSIFPPKSHVDQPHFQSQGRKTHSPLLRRSSFAVLSTLLSDRVERIKTPFSSFLFLTFLAKLAGIDSLVGMVFLGLFQVILRRQAFTENEQSVCVLI